MPALLMTMVEPAERLESGGDDGHRTRFVGHRGVARHGLAPGGLDLSYDVLRGLRRCAAALDLAADVGHHHPGPSRREQERVAAPDSAAGAGNDGHSFIEPKLSHVPPISAIDGLLLDVLP